MTYNFVADCFSPKQTL